MTDFFCLFIVSHLFNVFIFCLNNNYSYVVDSMCEDTQGKTALKFPSYRISLSLLCIVKYYIVYKVKSKGVSLCNENCFASVFFSTRSVTL